LKRFIEEQLLAWKGKKRRKPLIVRGARQVGKSWSIEHFGESEFDNLIKIDFEKNPEFIEVFNKNLEPGRIIKELELLKGQKIIPGKSLLFFDEVQNAPKAIAALRYFFEELPDFYVAAAGSLLDFALAEISFPVGRVQFTEMQPLCFAEYLNALGREDLADLIMKAPYKLSANIHNMLLDYMRSYFLTGGMPEAVQAYVEAGSFIDSFEVHNEIINTYRLDFSKYAPYADKQCLNEVLMNAAKNVGGQIKYSRLSDSFTNPTIKKAFNLLSLAKVLNKVKSTSGAGVPFSVNASEKVFKTLLVDIGLLRSMCHDHPAPNFNADQLLSIFQGALAEQFAGQEFLSASRQEQYYWANTARGASSEVDFLINTNNEIHPVEVKSGSAGSLKSMHIYLQKFPGCKKGIVLSQREYHELPEQKLSFIPIYFAYSIASRQHIL